MKKLISLLIALLAGFGYALAQVAFTDISASGDERTEIPLSMGINYFRFTAPETGTVSFSVGWSSVMIYQTDANATEESRVMLSRDTADDGYVYMTDVTAGTVYYFSTSIVMDAATVSFGYTEADSGIKLTANYADGVEVNTISGNLEVTIDRMVNISATKVIYGDGRSEDIPSDCVNSFFVTQYYCSISISRLVSYLIDGGKIAVGDSFTVRLEGITDANNPATIYGTDGSFEITFTLGELPATLVSISPADGSTLYTYYPEVGDDGLIVFSFSEPLNEDPAGVSVSMSWGDMEAGSYEAYAPPFTISGNTVTVDIRGIRIPETVDGGRGSSAAAATTVSFSISGLKTTDGRSVAPNYENAGTSAILAFYGVVKQTISFIYDFIPEGGSASLSGYSEIMIWLNNPVLYSGVTLRWQNARGGEVTREHTPGQVPFEWSADYDGYVAHVSLAGVSYTIYPVSVTVNDAYLMNGDPVTITGTFNTDPTGIDNVLTGIESDSAVKVFTVDGRLIRVCPADAAADGLAKGIYIIGGKKVVVK